MRIVYERETNNDKLYYTFPSGETIIKKTLATRLNEQKLQEALKEAKKEILMNKQKQNQLTSNERMQLITLDNSNDLDVIRETKNYSRRKNEIEYTGSEFQNLSKTTILEMSDGITSEEEKSLLKENKEEKEYITEAMSDDTGIYGYIRIPTDAGLKSGVKAKLRNNEEKEDKLCCDLLNSLADKNIIKNKTRFVWI
jgi:hypothetical protein